MPSQDDAATFQGALKDLAALLLGDLTKLWRLIQGNKLDATQTMNVLVAAGPDLVNPYAGHAAQLTTTWYDELSPSSTYKAVPAPLPPREALDASARWATSPLFGQTTAAETDDPLERLAGSMQRRVFDASRQTVQINAAAEPGTKWVRYASATACAFCRLLATREPIYSSEKAATRVVGRYTARGPSIRGSQSLGEKYHDHCRCVAVAIRPGDSYEPPDYVAEWNQEYKDAARAANGGGVKDILREMRKNDTH